MPDQRSAPNPLFLRDEELRQGLDLLFFAGRDLVAASAAVRERHGLGRADQRALALIARCPKSTPSQLQSRLKVTKQSLAPVLRRLAAAGLVIQTASAADRRQRHLHLTPAGVAVENEIAAVQRAWLATAYREAGADAVDGFRKVLLGLIDAADRPTLVPEAGDGRSGLALGAGSALTRRRGG